MGDTKIKIDLSSGAIEAEGNEQFVKSIYSDFKEKIKAHPPSFGQGTGTRRLSSKKKAEKNKVRISKSTKAKAGLQVIGDLDLSKKGSTPSLKNFYQKYTPKSNQERNLLFCYYLQQLKKQAPITLNHIYTCYRNIPRVKTPQNLYQSLIDTGRLKGWLSTRSMENLSLKVSGLNYVEHDMPKKESKE